MNAPISDPVAIKFAIGFYDAIGSGRTYQDAFDFGLNAIDDKTIKTYRTLYYSSKKIKKFSIPVLFTQQETIHSPILTKNEQNFVSQIFSQINQGVPQVILSQEGRDTRQMAQQLKKYAKTIFDPKSILHIYPSTNSNIKASVYFRRLGRQCQFTEPCNDSTEWTGLLEEKLYQGKAVFLLVADFGKGSDECRYALAGELRQLQEMFNQQLKIIIFGGEKLAEQVFSAGNLSLLNHANTQYVPELKLRDLQESYASKTCDEKKLQQILTISGGHPLLIRHLLIYAENGNYQQVLQQSSLASRLFTCYRQTTGNYDKVCSWLQHKHIQEFEDWPIDKLLRNLYWRNLLLRKNGQFNWRCEMIRKMGKKVLDC